jgi:hypothetical protein
MIRAISRAEFLAQQPQEYNRNNFLSQVETSFGLEARTYFENNIPPDMTQIPRNVVEHTLRNYMAEVCRPYKPSGNPQPRIGDRAATRP